MIQSLLHLSIAQGVLLVGGVIKKGRVINFIPSNHAFRYISATGPACSIANSLVGLGAGSIQKNYPPDETNGNITCRLYGVQTHFDNCTNVLDSYLAQYVFWWTVELRRVD